MGHRLTKIYTRTGDDGTTGLSDGTRVAKTHPRVVAMGTVDELNSLIGVLRSEPLDASLQQALQRIQHTLFDLGGELSIPGRAVLTEAHSTELEQTLDRLNADLSPLKEFILPGGSRAAALCHVARSTCRRAERDAFALAATEPVPPASLHYLNRLSDLLFVMARALNRQSGVPDTLWKPTPPGA